MLQRKIKRGTFPPLFDRIMDEKEAKVRSQLLNAQELRESIINELSTILNTHCTVRKAIYQDHIQSIPFFGFPDFFGLNDPSYFDAANPQEWSKAALFLETAIQAAEPRLKDIHVKVENYDIVKETLSISVSAFLTHLNVYREIHFPLEIKNYAQGNHKKIA